MRMTLQNWQTVMSKKRSPVFFHEKIGLTPSRGFPSRMTPTLVTPLARADKKLGQNSPKKTGAKSGGIQVAMNLSCQLFYLWLFHLTTQCFTAVPARRGFPRVAKTGAPSVVHDIIRMKAIRHLVGRRLWRMASASNCLRSICRQPHSRRKMIELLIVRHDGARRLARSGTTWDDAVPQVGGDRVFQGRKNL